MHFPRQPQLPLPCAPKPNRAGPCRLEETSSHVHHRFRPICHFGRKCAAPLFSQSGRPWACPPPLRGERRAAPLFLAETGPHDAKKTWLVRAGGREKITKRRDANNSPEHSRALPPNGVCVLRGALGGCTSPRPRPRLSRSGEGSQRPYAPIGTWRARSRRQPRRSSPHMPLYGPAQAPQRPSPRPLVAPTRAANGAEANKHAQEGSRGNALSGGPCLPSHSLRRWRTPGVQFVVARAICIL